MIPKISNVRYNSYAGKLFYEQFRKLSFIHYNGGLQVHSSLLNSVLHDWPHCLRVIDRALSFAQTFLSYRCSESLTAVVVPLDNHIILVGFLNCAEFSRRLPEAAKTLDAIARIQFLACGRGTSSGGLLGTSESGGHPDATVAAVELW